MLPTTYEDGESHNISEDFLIVNWLGAVALSGLFFIMAAAHHAHANEKHNRFEFCVKWLFLFGPLWLVYFLTMIIFRLRHAGKVCSGDYLPERFIIEPDESPYIHSNGLFLWSAIVG